MNNKVYYLLIGTGIKSHITVDGDKTLCGQRLSAHDKDKSMSETRPDILPICSRCDKKIGHE